MNWAQNKPLEQTNGTPPRRMAPFAAQRQRSADWHRLRAEDTGVLSWRGR